METSSRTGLIGTATALLALAALLPSPEFFAGTPPIQWVPAGIGAGLRIPALSALFSFPDQGLQRGDRIVAVRTESGEAREHVESREDLVRVLQPLQGVESVELTVYREGKDVVAVVPLISLDPRREAFQDWPIGVAGLIYFLVGLAAVAGGRHAVGPPIFVVSLCIGAALLGAFDALIPADPGLFGAPELRGRVALLALTLLPAAVVHFAMRFPVVHPRFRDPSLAASAYVVFAIPTALGQLRYRDANIVQGIEQFTLVMTAFALGMLVFVSLSGMQRLKPIERSRALALFAGLALSALGPLVMWFIRRGPSETMVPLAAASVLAPPVALGWALTRYRLLEPPGWLGNGLLAALRLMVAFVIARTLVELLPGDPPASLHGFEIAALTVIFYQLTRLVQNLLEQAGARRVTYEEALAEATEELTAASTPDRVLETLEGLILRHLEPAGFDVVRAGRAREPMGPLATRGLALWKDQGSPHGAATLAEARSEDPGPDQPEVVLSISPVSDEVVLLVASARYDGLPYSAEELRIFEALGQVATVAIGHAATSADLEQRVESRTASLERALSSRSRVLDAARGVHAAESSLEICQSLEKFVQSTGGTAEWSHSAPSGTNSSLVAEVERPPGEPRFLVAAGLDEDAREELALQLETVCAFANIALGRLALLEHLTQEVDRQAEKIAEIEASRRLAEFVRGVAHELRKPTDEIYQIARDLLDQVDGPIARKITRVAGVTQEMNRRIGLLMFHSGIRLDMRRIDLVQLVTNAVQRSQVADPDRHFQIAHELESLPLMGDPIRLLSVIENLIDNAVKATSDGGTIRIRSRLHLEPGDHEPQSFVVLEVEDDGVGLSEEVKSEIFQPGVSHFPGGFGLGLALCSEVVDRHGGEIRAEATEEGTRFWVSLPQFPDERHSEEAG